MKISMMFLMLAILFASCMKEDIASADMQVRANASSYKVGDTVVFRFEGAPDNIVFYSGENGHNYALKDRLYADNDLQVDFKTLVQWGVIYDNLKLLVSSNLVEYTQKKRLTKPRGPIFQTKLFSPSGKTIHLLE